MKKTLLFLLFTSLIITLNAQLPHFVIEPPHFEALSGDEIYPKRVVTVHEENGQYWALVEIGQKISPQAASNGPSSQKNKYGFERGSLLYTAAMLPFHPGTAGIFHKTEGRGWLQTDLPGYNKPYSFYSIAGDLSSDAVIWVPATANGDYIIVNSIVPGFYKALTYKYKHGFLNMVTGYGSYVVKYPNVPINITHKFR